MKWEYCEISWQTEKITKTIFYDDGPNFEIYQPADWPKLFARMGLEEWELVSTTSSPTGIHEYFFYFKRKLNN